MHCKEANSDKKTQQLAFSHCKTANTVPNCLFVAKKTNANNVNELSAMLSATYDRLSMHKKLSSGLGNSFGFATTLILAFCVYTCGRRLWTVIVGLT